MPSAAYWPLPPALQPAGRPAGPLSPPLAAADFLGVLRLYLPQGRAWAAKDDPDSVMSRFLEAFAERQFAAFQRETNIFAEISPASTFELIPEWEATLGLPDPCMPADPPTAMVQAQILTRFLADGGQSIGYFEAVAASLGATVTITELSDGRVDETACCEAWGSASLGMRGFACCDSGVGDPLSEPDPTAGSDWDYTLLVTVTEPYSYQFACCDSAVDDPLTDYSQNPVTAISEFACCDSDCQTPLASWGDSVVECELRRIMPGHCAVIFAYAPA
jgi:uncharacterized protein YmfQ (DUF2313 family)